MQGGDGEGDPAAGAGQGQRRLLVSTPEGVRWMRNSSSIGWAAAPGIAQATVTLSSLAVTFTPGGRGRGMGSGSISSPAE